MKNLKINLVLLLLIFGSDGNIHAQPFNDELKQDYDLFNSSTADNKEAAAIRLEQLAASYPRQWAANYYAAYADAAVSMTLPVGGKRDVYLDKADRYLKEVMSLDKMSDETYVLAAYVTYARFLIDPPGRWKKYLPVVNDNLEKAKQLNPANPRIYYLQGVPVFHRPKLFGGGKDKARPYFEKARELFAKQDRSSILKPYWGEKENADYLTKCN
jgi:hypothetical protein